MIGLYTLVRVAVLLLLTSSGLHSSSSTDYWADSCDPKLCRCKWVNRYKHADCANSSYTSIPANLSNSIQTLDISYNTVLEFRKDAFKSVNLENLLKLYARGCSIETVDKDAFRGLQGLSWLDLSDNNIHVLHPTTFRESPKLRYIHLNRNPIQRLQNGLFSNLSFLQSVEFNGCQISIIEPKTFYNVTKLSSLELSGNQLVNVKSEVLSSVPSLMNLEINNNPWRCDCKLRPFKDLVVTNNLKSASCAEPKRLANKLWNDIKADDFACQPIIQYPSTQSSTFELDDNQLTVECKVIGEPAPVVQWMFNNRTISSYSHADYKFTVLESVDNSMAKWINLTVSRSRWPEKSEFKCVAENAAGRDEREVTVIIQNYSYGGIGPSGVKQTLPVIIGLVAGIFIIILLLIVCCLCCCRRRPMSLQSKKLHTNGFSNGDIPHNHVTSLVSEPSEQQKSLLAVVNPVQKPPRRYESSPTGTEMTELKRNLLDETSISGDADERGYGESGDEVGSIDGGGSSVGGGHRVRPYRNDKGAPHPPDLLAFPQNGGHVSPAGSVVSSSLRSPLHSPVYSSGTLPYNRSQSPFNSRPAHPATGYVTIPRRPRAPSWAAAGSGASTPCGAAFVGLNDPLGVDRLCEPVYDNLGPRTTADGSSVLSLNKAVADSSVRRPAPQYSQTLPHKAKLSQPHQLGAAAARSRLQFDAADPGRAPPSPAPRSPPERAALHNTLPPNYSPLVEMDAARNRSSWAPGRAGTPETGVLKPAGQTSGKRKVPPKPPPKPNMKGGPLFEDEGEDGTEV